MARKWPPRGTEEYKRVKREYDAARYKDVSKNKSRNASEWAKKNPERAKRYRRNWALQKQYGITIEEYEILLTQQGGVCKICSGPPTGQGCFHVDHCHNTHEVRGLLCSKCNAGLGYFNDDPQRLQKAIEYLNA